MNQKKAVVTNIDVTKVVTYIDVKCGETDLRLIKSKAPIWLSEGDEITCKFPEVSVCVSKECPGKVSIENKLPGTLVNIRQSSSLCELTFESDIGEVVSLITLDAYNSLGLKKECRATMLLRGVDISIDPIVSSTRTKDAN